MFARFSRFPSYSHGLFSLAQAIVTMHLQVCSKESKCYVLPTALSNHNRPMNQLRLASDSWNGAAELL
jgi:hypothetical protein